VTERAPEGGARTHELMIVGRVRKPQGIHGELLVEPLTDMPDVIFASGSRVFGGTAAGDRDDSASPLTVRRARPFKGGYIIGFAELTERTAADQWRGRYLLSETATRRALAEDEIYRHELLGMLVLDDNLGELGKVTELYDFPQGLTLEVGTRRGPVLVPYRPEIVREVDLESRCIRISAPEGLVE
jgi:16S rRNA processing protein RimM